MTILDTRYILSPALQQIFRDRESGLPLRNGYVEFYRDVSRIDPKDVFIQSGAPGAYEAVSIGNVVTLSQAGAFSYDNNDVAILYFPFFQTAEGEIVDKYFIRVFNENGVEQFTREGWPQGLSDTDEEDNTFVNYIADGQFWNHRNLPNNGTILPETNFITYSSGLTTGNSANAGSWVIYTSPGSTTEDRVTFDRLPSYQSLPEASPRYYLRYRCITPDLSDTAKHLIYRIANVNFGASTTEFFTFQFESTNIFSGSTIINLRARKYFGFAGSAEEDIFIKQFSVIPGWNKYTANFVLGDNAGKNIGPNDDDMIEFYLEIPTDQSSDIAYDNFILRDGSFTTLKQQFTNPQQNQSATLTMPVPAHDLTDEGKVPVLRSFGFRYENNNFIGDVKYSYSSQEYDDWLLITNDGQTIGNESSGAIFDSNSNNMRTLYSIMWPLPGSIIEGGVKTDPNLDFNNGLFLTLPPMVGRALGSAGSGSGLTLRTLGSITGAETHQLTISEMPSHTHNMPSDSEAQLGGSQRKISVDPVQNTSTGSAGGDVPHNNMQPTVFLNAYIYWGGEYD